MKIAFHIVVLISLALASNVTRAYLEIDPDMGRLDYSTIRAGAFSLFFGVFVASVYSALAETGRCALGLTLGCLLLGWLYPASLLAPAVIAGMFADVPGALWASVCLGLLGLCLTLVQFKKTSTWFALDAFTPLRLATAVFFLASLPTIWLSGLFGDHTPAFVNLYGSFLYATFAVMLVSAWLPKALNLLPHATFLWAGFLIFTIWRFGFLATGYFIAAAFHLLWSIVYLVIVIRKKQTHNE